MSDYVRNIIENKIEHEIKHLREGLYFKLNLILVLIGLMIFILILIMPLSIHSSKKETTPPAICTVPAPQVYIVQPFTIAKYIYPTSKYKIFLIH